MMGLANGIGGVIGVHAGKDAYRTGKKLAKKAVKKTKKLINEKDKKIDQNRKKKMKEKAIKNKLETIKSKDVQMKEAVHLKKTSDPITFSYSSKCRNDKVQNESGNPFRDDSSFEFEIPRQKTFIEKVKSKFGCMS